MSIPVALKDVTLRFGSHVVVDGFNLVVERGARHGLHGPNGSGKTTVMRCMAGTLTPSRGEALIGEYLAGTLDASRLCGFSFSQERAFYLRMSAEKNLLLYAKLRLRSRAGARRAVDSLLEELEIADFKDERVDHCSTGMIQQLSFARALIGSPPILLLDEPTRSMDESALDRFWRALDERPRCTVVLTSHLQEDLSRCNESTAL